MPSANASRKSQEKPREIMDAAEVGSLLPRAWEDRPRGPDCTEGGNRVSGALSSGSLSALCLQAAGLGSGHPEASLGLQGLCPNSVARPTPDRISHEGSREAWPARSVFRGGVDVKHQLFRKERWGSPLSLPG